VRKAQAEEVFGHVRSEGKRQRLLRNLQDDVPLNDFRAGTKRCWISCDSGPGDARNRISAAGFLTPKALFTLFGVGTYKEVWGDKGPFVIQVNARDPQSFPCTAAKRTPGWFSGFGSDVQQRIG
jgi:hypothetical protein